MSKRQAIGVFDSGYGGLTILREFIRTLPGHDYIYLGDNARTPYGPRSFETVYQYTLQAVRALFDMGCPLVILACNTASAKALRSIQQKDLPRLAPDKRVLGVIRPSTEIARQLSQTGHVGILGTEGTVRSESYLMELAKLHPGLSVSQQACPMWVPLVENNQTDTPGADYFVKKDIDALLKKDPEIDTIILGCTHYPLLMQTIRRHLPRGVHAYAQDTIVANSLADYLKRRPEMDRRITKNASLRFYTTESPDIFNNRAGIFFGKNIEAEKLEL